IFIMVICFSACSPAPDLSFTEKITVQYTTHNENIKFEITDSKDIQEIIAACTENARSRDGDCGFDVVQLTFEGGNKQVKLLPAGDNCDVIKYGDLNYDKYYLIGEESKIKLISILHKYGLSFEYLSTEIIK
ncbi:MAG: hypothetical protein ACOYJD_09530, partial [Christensenellales bacterium]